MSDDVKTTTDAPESPAGTATTIPAEAEAQPATAPAAGALPPIPRSRQQIRVDYTNTAAQLGETRFQRECLQQRENQLMNQLDNLVREEQALPPEAKKPVALKAVPPPADGTE